MLTISASATLAAPYPLLKLETPADAGEVAPVVPPDTDDEVARKIHAQLRAAAGSDAAGLPRTLASDDEVLVELRFTADAGLQRAEQALSRAKAEVRNVLAADRVEAHVARDQLYGLARDADVVSIVPARLARPRIGSRTSEGVAAGRADLWHANTPALTGSGVTIAVIDAFDDTSGEINSLQLAANNNWPPDSRVVFQNYKTLPSPAPAGCATNTFWLPRRQSRQRHD